MFKSKFFPALLAFILLTSGCSTQPDLPLLWRDMTVAQRVERLEGQLEAARLMGERNMRGDLKRAVLEMVKNAKQNPSPEFTPVMTEAAELVIKFKFNGVASEVYEVLGDKPKALEYARLSGDLERGKNLLANMKDSSDGQSGDLEDSRISLGLDLLESAETTFSRESGPHYTTMGNPRSETRKLLADSVEQLKGAPLTEKDVRRLLHLQFETAIKDEPLTIAKEAEWVRPSELSTEEYLLRKIKLWNEQSNAHRASPKVAGAFLEKARQELENKALQDVPEGSQKELLELRAEVAFGSGEFDKAQGYAKQLFPNDKRVLLLYKFAATSSKDSIRNNPYTFPSPVKSDKEQTYISLFSPNRRYVEKGFDELVEAPGGEFTWESPDKGQGEGTKVSFRSDSGYLYLLSLASGFRRPLEPALYDNASQTGVTPAHPSISFAGEGNFKYGQFRVYEVEWEGGKEKKLAHLALDFLGSSTGDLSDVCYGKLRYRSRYK